MELKEVKRNLQQPVIFSKTGTEYLLTGCIIRKNKQGEFFYQAELEDITGQRNVLICRLEDIEDIHRKE